MAMIRTSERRVPLQLRFSNLSRQDIPIVEAAESVGYDCSTWENVRRLIVAVRGPERPVTYPDRWTGPGAYRSSIYPDRWRPSLDLPRPDLPHARPGQYTKEVGGPPSINVNTASLPIRSKRRNDDFVDLTQDVLKRRRTDPIDQSDNLIDLTGDDDDDDEIFIAISNPDRPSSQSSMLTSMTNHRRVLSDISNTNINENTNTINSRPQTSSWIPAPVRGYEDQQRERTALLNQQRIKSARKEHTATLLHLIAGRMYMAAADVDTDRKILRERWDADDKLKEIGVTNALTDLNACFERLEDALTDAVEVIEDRLLYRF